MPITDITEKRAYQRDWKARRRSEWIASKGGACAECGSREALEVDHIDPSTKLCNPTLIWSRNRAFRDAELAKCQVLCRPCHETKSWDEAPHGSRTRYQEHGCRCADCRAWNAGRVRKQRERKTS